MKVLTNGMTSRALPPSSPVEMQRTTPASPAHWYRTTRVEQALLFATVALLPLENHIPAFMGMGFMFYVFAVPTIYVLWNRIGFLDRTWAHPVFLAAYGFLVVMVLLEVTHPYTAYSEITRTFQMIFGAVLIASLCRDQPALRAGLYGWIAAGLWVTIYLLSTGYSQISAVTATDFDAASEVRDQTFKATSFVANLNSLAFFAAQAGVGALALALKERSSGRRILFLGVMLVCAVGAFVPMSRGGIMILAIACAGVMGAYGVMKTRMLVILALLAIGIWLLVPEAVYSRLVYKAHSYEPGKLEGRTQIYTAVLESLPEYVVTGVGAGHFWKSWGANHGFTIGREVLGSHNCFAQTTIYWGIGGLLGLLAVIWQAYRYFPTSIGTDSLKLCLFGTSLALLSLTVVIHDVYAKEFSLGLGFLVGASQWIWPRSSGQARYQRQEHFVSSLRRRS